MMGDPAPKRLHAVVRGRVQGVSFRAFTASVARRLGLAGWVRNRPDGSVEVLAEGAPSDLEALVSRLHEGPPLARVDAVEQDWSAATGDLEPFHVGY